MKGNESTFINYHQDPVDNGEGNFPPQSRHIRMILYCLFSHNATNYSSLPTEWQHSDMMSLLTNAHDTFSSLTLWLSASCCTSLFKPPSLLCHSFIGKNNITYGFVIDTFSLDTCVHSPRELRWKRLFVSIRLHEMFKDKSCSTDQIWHSTKRAIFKMYLIEWTGDNWRQLRVNESRFLCVMSKRRPNTAKSLRQIQKAANSF